VWRLKSLNLSGSGFYQGARGSDLLHRKCFVGGSRGGGGGPPPPPRKPETRGNMVVKITRFPSGSRRCNVMRLYNINKAKTNKKSELDILHNGSRCCHNTDQTEETTPASLHPGTQLH
jgi:hypothetical protein